MATRATHLVEHIGVFTPKSENRPHLSAGEVGFIIAGIKELEHAKVGDTITLAGKPAEKALPGFKEVKPQVFAGLYPVESSEYDQLRDSLEKLKLNDSSLMFEPEVSQALGFLVSVAASWACFIWKSSRSVWSANSTWISSPPRRRWCTRSNVVTAKS